MAPRQRPTRSGADGDGAAGRDRATENNDLVQEIRARSSDRLSEDQAVDLVEQLVNVLEDAVRDGRAGAPTLPTLLEVIDTRHPRVFDRLQQLAILESLVIAHTPRLGAQADGVDET